MKKYSIITFFVCTALTAMITLATAASQMPGTEAGELWTYITETNAYTKWDKWPGKDGMYPGKSPHGAFLKLYVNEIALKAINEKTSMPEDAIIVKENYAEDKEQLLAITPMYKKKGYNPAGGDWFWAKYGPAGEVMASGKVDGCIKCHSTQTDWLFTGK
jgi:hypothetical protein